MARIKLYSVDEAERTLPLVKRIVRDIMKHYDDHENRLIERKKLPLTPASGSTAEERAFQLEREMDVSREEVMRCQGELAAMGIELKDYHTGLLDFYSRYDGRIVFLCWKNDEDSLSHWHDLQAGFQGRQSITPANRQRFKGMEPGQKFVDVV